MLLREVKYYLMTNNQLGKEITKIRFKLDGERDIRKVKKYLNQLDDIAKALIRKNRNDDDFMRNARWMLYSLKAQTEKAQEESHY